MKPYKLVYIVCLRRTKLKKCRSGYGDCVVSVFATNPFPIVISLQDRSYTLMMIDPDYPHHSNGQFYLHWLVTNIPVN